ncbi:MAG: thiamine-phosphate kinase [Solirubrobacterales bacterium]
MSGIGEFELIDAIRARLRDAGAPERSAEVVLGSGDDAAISADAGTRVTSVDAAVEGVHFRIPPFDHRHAGGKALAAALSDIAAMGARATEAYVQLGVPEDLRAEQCLELASGIGEVAAEHGVAVPGGDLTRSPVLFLAVTAIGVADGEPVTRAGARPGDSVVVTGDLGGAAAGLLLLDRPDLGSELEAVVADALRSRQLEPRPRLGAGVALARSGATAMIDISDGLGADAGHVAAAGGVGLELELARLPLQPGVEDLARAAGVDPARWSVGGGEDYELLATLPDERIDAASRALAELDVSLTVVGAVVEGEGAVVSSSDGAPVDQRGFDQLRSPPTGPPGPA